MDVCLWKWTEGGLDQIIRYREGKCCLDSYYIISNGP